MFAAAVKEKPHHLVGVIDAKRLGTTRTRNVQGREGAAGVDKAVVYAAVAEKPHHLAGVIDAIRLGTTRTRNVQGREGAAGSVTSPAFSVGFAPSLTHGEGPFAAGRVDAANTAALGPPSVQGGSAGSSRALRRAFECLDRPCPQRKNEKAPPKRGLFEPTRALTQPCLRRRERPRAAKLRPTRASVAGSGTSLCESLVKFQVMRSSAFGGFVQPTPQRQPVGPVW